MNQQIEKKPFWQTGDHPILGYYYNSLGQSRQHLYKENVKKRETPLWR